MIQRIDSVLDFVDVQTIYSSYFQYKNISSTCCSVQYTCTATRIEGVLLNLSYKSFDTFGT